MPADNITVNTQSSIRISGSQILYFDPFQIRESRQDADVIFLTHDHYDHFDRDSIRKVMKEDTIFVLPKTMEAEVADLAKGHPVIGLLPDQNSDFKGLLIHSVPAYNKLKPFHPKKNGWLGYLVKMDEVTYYIAGDTDALRELETVRCDVALVPIGGKFTMNAFQAAGLVNEIGPRVAIPTHYGSIVGSRDDQVVFRNALNRNIQVEIKLA